MMGEKRRGRKMNGGEAACKDTVVGWGLRKERCAGTRGSQRMHDHVFDPTLGVRPARRARRSAVKNHLPTKMHNKHHKFLPYVFN